MVIDYFFTRKMGFEKLGLGSYYTRLPLSCAPANVSGICGKMSKIIENYIGAPRSFRQTHSDLLPNPLEIERSPFFAEDSNPLHYKGRERIRLHF